jgi:hypothetical protein
MATTKTYATAGAFRVALEERLRRRSQTDRIDINRLRRQVSFDRLLARLFRGDSVPWALKGGYALELRFKTARSAVDMERDIFHPGLGKATAFFARGQRFETIRADRDATIAWLLWYNETSAAADARRSTTSTRCSSNRTGKAP